MYKVIFTQVFDHNDGDFSSARSMAADLIKNTLAGVSAASVEIAYVKEEENDA